MGRRQTLKGLTAMGKILTPRHLGAKLNELPVKADSLGLLFAP